LQKFKILKQRLDRVYKRIKYMIFKKQSGGLTFLWLRYFDSTAPTVALVKFITSQHGL